MNRWEREGFDVIDRLMSFILWHLRLFLCVFFVRLEPFFLFFSLLLSSYLERLLYFGMDGFYSVGVSCGFLFFPFSGLSLYQVLMIGYRTRTR
ncbi:uncharacterized protein BDW43DRAFT_106673 [Aspergillus alliaceus]|uniref:uncharacterized protein n=1 Tax=Petromyces alliaceus TaxID=209559 RepID=UPI0012A59590|nr:uncharacterized protein BDW43DRAFT_106673 [Aspergillus alliaceus]KAB8232566.1 hypothetical protein BDW43DRAFT_106673 [Aspergillus alliaceus]